MLKSNSDIYRKYLSFKIQQKITHLLLRSKTLEKCFEELEKVSVYFPKFLSVVFTNICNANCVFCAYKYKTYNLAVIEDDLLDKIAQEYSAIGGGIIGNSANLGDPLADPYFWKHLEIVRKYKNISTPIVVTNLIGAKRLGSERLALEGPTHLSVTIGGFNRLTYKSVFGVDCYCDVIESLFTILETRKTAGIPLDVSVSCRSNLPWRRHIREPDFKRLLNYLDFKSIVFQSKNFDNWAGLITEKDLLPGMTLRKNRMNKKFPCINLYDNLGILPDGTAVACACREANAMSSLVVGNVQTNKLIEIGKNVARIRRNWLNGSLPSICQGCTGYSVAVLRGLNDELFTMLRDRHEFIIKNYINVDK